MAPLSTLTTTAAGKLTAVVAGILLMGVAAPSAAQNLPLATSSADAGAGPETLTVDDGTQATPLGCTVTETGDRVLSGVVRLSGFQVPAGETWSFDPNQDTTVVVDANVVVRGKLEMKPASPDVVHTLKFENIDETKMVGGHTDKPIPEDVGLWVLGDGQVDFQGSPKAGWNRTGNDPTWKASDDIVVAPTAKGDYTGFKSFTPGDSVPSVTGPNGKTYRTEVANLTRNVRIYGGGQNPPGEVLSDDGRAHMLFLKTNKPQTIKYAEFRWMGPRTTHDRDGTNGVMSRYPVHWHHSGDSARGSVVEGVVVRDSGNRAFVPHGSNGITFTDTIAYNVWESAYWYDPGETNASHDLTFDHTAAMLIRDYPSYRGYSLKGFTLGEGSGNAVRDSVAVGLTAGSDNGGGFHWPSSANQSDVGNVWDFQNNVAHNNKGSGISVWQNDFYRHIIESFVSYRNGRGTSHGAYINLYTYRNGVSFGEDLTLHALGDIRFEDITLAGNLRITNHSLPSEETVIFDDVEIDGQIVVNESDNAGRFHFVSSTPKTDLARDDFEIVNLLSEIVVTNSDGTSFTLR